jgi:hypothetical protein
VLGERKKPLASQQLTPKTQNLAPNPQYPAPVLQSLLGLALAGSLGLLDSFFFFSGSFFSVDEEESAEELLLGAEVFFA